MSFITDFDIITRNGGVVNIVDAKNAVEQCPQAASSAYLVSKNPLNLIGDGITIRVSMNTAVVGIMVRPSKRDDDPGAINFGRDGFWGIQTNQAGDNLTYRDPKPGGEPEDLTLRFYVAGDSLHCTWLVDGVQVRDAIIQPWVFSAESATKLYVYIYSQATGGYNGGLVRTGENTVNLGSAPPSPPPTIRIWSEAGENLVVPNKQYAIELANFPPDTDINLTLYTSDGLYTMGRIWRTDGNGYLRDETQVWYGMPYGTSWYWQWITDPSVASPTFMEYVSPPPPVPTHILNIGSNIMSTPLIVRGVSGELSYVTPIALTLGEGIYEVEFPATVVVGSDTYAFSTWEDGSLNPTRTINLLSDVTIGATYEIVPGILDIKAYIDNTEIVASIEIVGVGTYITSISLDLPPGSYTINAAYQDQSQSKIATIISDQTTTIEFIFVVPPTPPEVPPEEVPEPILPKLREILYPYAPRPFNKWDERRARTTNLKRIIRVLLRRE